MTDIRQNLEYILTRAGSLRFDAEGSQDDVRQAFDFISELASALIEVLDAQPPSTGEAA